MLSPPSQAHARDMSGPKRRTPTVKFFMSSLTVGLVGFVGFFTLAEMFVIVGLVQGIGGH